MSITWHERHIFSKRSGLGVLVDFICRVVLVPFWHLYGLLSLCRSLAFVSVTTRGTLPQNDTRFFRKKRFILWNALQGWSKSVCVSFFNSVAGGLNWATLNLKLVFSCSYYWVNICAKDPKKQHVTTPRQITSNTFDTYDVGAGYATDMPFVLQSYIVHMFTYVHMFQLFPLKPLGIATLALVQRMTGTWLPTKYRWTQCMAWLFA